MADGGARHCLQDTWIDIGRTWAHQGTERGMKGFYCHDRIFRLRLGKCCKMFQSRIIAKYHSKLEVNVSCGCVKSWETLIKVCFA